MIANEILKPIDEHISRACRCRGLAYSRFIDDITISGRYDLKSCRIGEVVKDILERHHFRVAKSKTTYGRLDVPPVRERSGIDAEQLSITGVRLKRDHLDPSKKFVQELDRIIADHLSLASDGPFEGPLFLQSEVFGKAYYACSLNTGRRRTILAKLEEVNWWNVMGNAVDRGLLRFSNRLKPRGMPRPDCSDPLPLAAGAKHVREYYKNHAYDPAEAPFDVLSESVSAVK